MFRGTTPTLTFHLQFEADEIDEAYATFVQSNEVKIDKPLSDMRIDGKDLVLTLTQEETLKLKGNSAVEIQLSVRIGNNVMRSKIMNVTVNRILKESAI